MNTDTTDGLPQACGQPWAGASFEETQEKNIGKEK